MNIKYRRFVGDLIRKPDMLKHRRIENLDPVPSINGNSAEKNRSNTGWLSRYKNTRLTRRTSYSY